MVDSLFDNNPENFIPIFYHLNSNVTVPWCNQRAGFFALQYTPYLWLDGANDCGYTYNDWNSDFQAHQTLPTDVTMNVEGFRDGAEVDIRATVCVEFGGTSKTMRIYIAQVLDHFPSTEIYYRNALRQAETQDVWVEANTCVNVHSSMTLKAEDLAQMSDVGIIAWAQEPLASAPAGTYQATVVYDPDGIMGEGMESGDLSGWDYP